MTKEKYTLAVKKRTVLGKKSKQLRSNKLIPANLYGADIASQAIEIPAKELEKVYRAAGETALVYVSVEGDEKTYPVLFSEVQRHPVSGAVLHASLYKVNLKEKVEADIPLETKGESPIVKTGAVLVVTYNTIPVEALPTDLPENFSIDISVLTEIGQNIHVKDLVYDRSKVEVKLDGEDVLATIQAPKVEVVEVAPEEPAEVETTVQGKKEEAEAGETEAKPAVKPEKAKTE